MPPPDPDILRRNLAALRRADAALADRLADTDPLALQWAEARTGRPIATLPAADAGGSTGRPAALASRFDPEAEAAKLVGGLDADKTACLVLLGLGLGYTLDPALQLLGPRGCW